MAYQVDKFNGTFLTSVEDGTIDTTTDLRFVGKNYAGYGEVQNENFLHLLENFANTTSPPKAVEGQVWYDSGNKRLKFYDGNKFKSAAGAETSDTAPSGLATGEFWWDTSAKQLYEWDGGAFVLVGPEASPDLGVSGVAAQVVKDTGNTNHSILKILAGGKVVAVISQTSFTLNSAVNPIDDFTLIKKGITLAATDANGISGSDFVYWGTTSNSLKLGGIDADNFIQKGSVSFNSTVVFDDNGYLLGDQRDLKAFVESDDQPVIESQLGNPLSIVVSDGVTRNYVAKFETTGVNPGVTGAYDLGTTNLRWKEIYATSIDGSLTGNVTGNVTGSVTGNVVATDTQVLINATTKEIGYASATLRGTLFGNVSGNVTGTASNASNLNNLAPSDIIPSPLTPTIAVRDSSGNITANQFVGISDKADRLRINDSATDTDPNYRSAKTTATADTIVARTNVGDINANLFQGTATAARYADLAEKYLTDKDYEPGTVISVGGHREVTASNIGEKAIGVVSSSPAFMMNSHLSGGQYIALKGRVPVKVTGPVAKGDRLIASNDGIAVVATDTADYVNVFAIALVDDNQEGVVRLIEAVIL